MIRTCTTGCETLGGEHRRMGRSIKASKNIGKFCSREHSLTCASPVQIFTISKHPFDIAVQNTQHPDA
jgi:hypothetical protein